VIVPRDVETSEGERVASTLLITVMTAMLGTVEPVFFAITFVAGVMGSLMALVYAVEAAPRVFKSCRAALRETRTCTRRVWGETFKILVPAVPAHLRKRK